MQLIVAEGVQTSPARTRPPTRDPWRIGAVQVAWHPDPDTHAQHLGDGVALAAAEGAEFVCLQELTLSPYFASVGGGAGAVD
ncbi:MAG: hydrolase, partial [Actinomycetes bacterium]